MLIFWGLNLNFNLAVGARRCHSMVVVSSASLFSGRPPPSPSAFHVII